MKIQPRSVLTFLCVLAFLFYGFYRVLLIFKYSADIGGSENSVVYFIQRILAGFSPYTDPQLPPYAIAQYPPLYYYLVVLLAKLAGIGPDDVMSVFMVNRVCGLFCNLLYILSVFFISKNIFSISTRRSLAISLLCVVFLEPPSFARPDSLNLAISLWSLFFFLKWISRQEEQRSVLLLVISAFLCAIGFLAKQTSVTLPLLICVWLLVQKKGKHLSRFLAVYILIIVLSLVLLHLEFGIKAVYQNIVLGINNGIGVTWFWDFIVSYLFGSFGTVWMLASIVIYTRLKRTTGDLFHFSRLLLPGLFFFSLLFSLKWGSWISYFTEWWTILFILTGYYWDELKQALKQLSPYFPQYLVGAVLLIKLISITYPLYINAKTILRGEKTSYNIDKVAAQWIIQNNRNPKGLVFNNHNNIHLFLNNFLFRVSVLPQHEIVNTLYHRNIFDYSNFRKSLTDGSVQYIITDAYSTQLTYMDNEIKNFKPVYRSKAFLIYRFERPAP